MVLRRMEGVDENDSSPAIGGKFGVLSEWGIRFVVVVAM